MPYFFDTNIIIGYLFFSVDRLGLQAETRVLEHESKHTGYNTQIECFGENGDCGKCLQIHKEIDKEILKMKAQLQRLEPIDYQQYPRIRKLIEKYPEYSDIDLDSMQINLDKEFVERKEKILNPKTCEWHSKRDEDYREAYSTLITLTHWQDVEVLLDAYEVGKSIPNLVFVTGDKEIIKNKEAIRKCLENISDIIPP